MRVLLGFIVLLSTLPGCAGPVRRATAADPEPTQARMAAAGALIRAGCLDCLIDAYRIYEALLNSPAVGEDATAAAVRAAALIALRERELGIVDSGAFIEARALADALPAQVASFAPLFDIIETLGVRGAMGNSALASDAQLSAVATANRNRTAWTESLRLRANENELTAYLWLAFNCSYNRPSDDEAGELLGAVADWRDSPLIRFRFATCGAFRPAVLEQLVTDNPRFVEVSYYRSFEALIAADPDGADAHLARAQAWRPRWPAVTNARAGIFITAEEFESALEAYDRTLAVTAMPAAPGASAALQTPFAAEHFEALLGKVRALTYLERHAEALSAIADLLEPARWYVGDAYYWRAMNELSLGRAEEAWGSVEQAARLITNADVPKLAGIIAVQRGELVVARAKFEEAHERNRADCDVQFYLGVVLSDGREWARSIETLTDAVVCFDRSQAVLEAQVARISASSAPPARQQRQIARREQQLAWQARLRATARFNAAVGAFNLSRHVEARQNAERLVDDPQLGARARDLLSRLPLTSE